MSRDAARTANPFAHTSMFNAFNPFHQAWQGSSPLQPMMDPTELDKRIADLRTVEHWLDFNLTLLRGTIQTLEMQRASLQAFHDLSSAFRSATQATGPGADAPTTPAAPEAPAPAHAAPHSTQPYPDPTGAATGPGHAAPPGHTTASGWSPASSAPTEHAGDSTDAADAPPAAGLLPAGFPFPLPGGFPPNPFGAPALPAGPFGPNPFQGGAFPGNPFQGNPLASNPFTANPFVGNPFAAGGATDASSASEPFTANPFLSNPFQHLPWPTPADPTVSTDAGASGQDRPPASSDTAGTHPPAAGGADDEASPAARARPAQRPRGKTPPAGQAASTRKTSARPRNQG